MFLKYSLCLRHLTHTISLNPHWKAILITFLQIRNWNTEWWRNWLELHGDGHDLNLGCVSLTVNTVLWWLCQEGLWPGQLWGVQSRAKLQSPSPPDLTLSKVTRLFSPIWFLSIQDRIRDALLFMLILLQILDTPVIAIKLSSLFHFRYLELELLFRDMNWTWNIVSSGHNWYR